MKMTTSAVLAAATLLAACDGVGDRQVPGATTMDAELRALITAEGLTGDPSIGRNLPTVTDPLAQLGMQLFFSKALGGDRRAGSAGR